MRSSRDPPIDARRDRGSRVRSAGHPATLARWHALWCVRGRGPAPACAGPACPGFPGAFHFAAATRVWAFDNRVLHSIIDRSIHPYIRCNRDFVSKLLERQSTGGTTRLPWCRSRNTSLSRALQTPGHL